MKPTFEKRICSWKESLGGLKIHRIASEAEEGVFDLSGLNQKHLLL